MYDFQHRYGDIKHELVNLDSRNGAATASIYDITAYPALMALREDGSVAQIWQGETLPLMDEVAGYTLTTS